MKSFLVLIIVFLTLVAGAKANEKLTCYEVVKAHGLASRVQFMCGFKQYNTEAIGSTRDCAAILDDEQLKASLMEGMKVLDDLEKAMGNHQKACVFLQSHYSELVRP